MTYNSVDQELLEFEYLGCTATTAFIWEFNGRSFFFGTREKYLTFGSEKRYLQCANVGDSSAYLFQPGSITPLSKGF